MITNLVGNLIPCLVVGAILFAVWRAGREPLWGEAYRRLRANRTAMFALALIVIYCAVGFLDSIGWQAGKNSPRVTVVDRIFAHVPQERTYSAPLATETTGEPHPHKLTGKHLLGTDAVGKDVLFKAVKGCRTALIVGGLTQLIVTPIALLLGMLAGYFGKRVDDLIQYIYTVLDSIPSILLLIVLLMVMGPGLMQICIALGVTSWVGLCRLVRGETLKHRDRDYIRAARALGMGSGRVMLRHILPNLLPVVIITATLGISGNILSETILSYLQIGVPPDVGSWGNMIDAARLELAREPAIWWNLEAASVAVLMLVWAVNIFGDALCDSVDPRLRS